MENSLNDGRKYIKNLILIGVEGRLLGARHSTSERLQARAVPMDARPRNEKSILAT